MITSQTASMLQAVYDNALLDTAHIWQYSDGSADSYNIPGKDYDDQGAVNCLYKPLNGSEKFPLTHVGEITARIAFPDQTDIRTADRVQLVTLNGQALSPAKWFEVVGEPEADQFGVIVNIKSITTGETS